MQGGFPEALVIALGRAGTEPVSGSVFLIILGLQTSVSGNFKSTTDRMNKYLVT